jgi:hypothetical protein
MARCGRNCRHSIIGHLKFSMGKSRTRFLMVFLFALGSVAVLTIYQKNIHYYEAMFTCIGEIGAPCVEFQSASDATLPGSDLFLESEIMTAGSFPLRCTLRLKRRMSDFSLPIETLNFRPWAQMRSSQDLGTVTTRIFVTDSVAILTIQIPSRLIQITQPLRKNW